jgi:hypothetical protein
MFSRPTGTPSDEERAAAKREYEIRMGIISVQELGDQASENDPHLREVRAAREARLKTHIPPEPGAALSDAAILEIDARLSLVEARLDVIEGRWNKKTNTKKDQPGEQEKPAFVES